MRGVHFSSGEWMQCVRPSERAAVDIACAEVDDLWSTHRAHATVRRVLRRVRRSNDECSNVHCVSAVCAAV